MAFLPRWVLLCMALFWCAGTVGCCHDPFDLTVSLHDSLRDTRNVLPAVEVDLVMVNNSDLPAWQQKSMTEYFEPHDPMRDSADKIVFKLGEDHKSETLSAKSDAGKTFWSDWSNNKDNWNLLVLSHYPSPSPDLPGDQDPRRRTLPLNCDRWDGEKELKFVVKSSGLTVLTPPKPPKQ